MSSVVGRLSIAILLVVSSLIGNILVGCAGASNVTAEGHAQQGYELITQGRYDEAIEECSKAIELDPSLTAAYVNRALTYIFKEQYDLAIADCSKAVELDPSYSKAYNNRAFCYINLGQYDLAIADCSKAIELAPNLFDAYGNRAVAYEKLGKYDLAINDIQKGISLTDNPQIIKKGEEWIERLSK